MRVFEREYKGVQECLVEGVMESHPMEFLGVVLVDAPIRTPHDSSMESPMTPLWGVLKSFLEGVLWSRGEYCERVGRVIESIRRGV